RLAARNVNAGAFDCRLAHAQTDAVTRIELPRILYLLFVELSNILRGLFQNVDQFVIRVGGIAPNMFLRNAHQLRREIELVETSRVLADSLVATPPNIVDDSADGLLDGLFDVI